jgi:outer membrane protein
MPPRLLSPNFCQEPALPSNPAISHMIRHACLAVFLVFAIFFPDSVSARSASPPPAAHSLMGILQWVYDNNPSLNAARAEYRAVQEKLPQAYANFKPVLAARAGVLVSRTEGNQFGFGGAGGAAPMQGAGTNADGTTSKEIALTLDQPIFRGGRSVAQLDGAKHVIAAQEAILLQTTQDILLETARIYMDVQRDQALLELAENNMDVISSRLEETQARFDAGELTLTDVAQAKARLAAGRANLVSAQGSLRASLARFEKIVGFRPDRQLDRPVLYLPIPASLEELERKTLESNPALLAADSVYNASEADQDRAFGELLPEIGFTAEWSKTYDPQPGLQPDQENKSFGVSARIPLYQAGAVRSRIREAGEISAQRKLEAEDTRNLARQNAAISWEEYQSSIAEVDARQSQIEAAALAREGVSAEELAGTRTILDTLDAEQEYLQAQVDLITAQRNAVVSRFSVLSNYGGLTPENLWLAGGAPLTGSHNDMVRRKILESNVDSFMDAP